jgi:hypothetical protein
MNCGLNQADQERLRGQFGQHVNRVGLFPSEPIALKFAEKLDKLVPEHAPFMPFYVYIAHAA